MNCSAALQVQLPFVLRTEPLGTVQVTLTAEISDGSARLVPLQASAQSPSRRLTQNDGSGSLQYDALSWFKAVPVLLEVKSALTCQFSAHESGHDLA